MTVSKSKPLNTKQLFVFKVNYQLKEDAWI